MKPSFTESEQFKAELVQAIKEAKIAPKLTDKKYQIGLETKNPKLVEFFDSHIDCNHKINSIPSQFSEKIGYSMQYFLDAEQYEALKSTYIGNTPTPPQ